MYCHYIDVMPKSIFEGTSQNNKDGNKIVIARKRYVTEHKYKIYEKIKTKQTQGKKSFLAKT